MLSDAERKTLIKAQALWRSNELDEAWELVGKVLVEHPYDPVALSLAGHVYEKAGNIALSYHLFKLATEQDPKNADHLLNCGRVAEELWRTTESERMYHKALKLSKSDETTKFLYGNLAALCIDNARYPEAEEWAQKALDRWPDDRTARSNLGFAQLGLRKWVPGWANYRHCIGTKLRLKFDYKGEPLWEGQPDQTVVLYGEQGIGDEISFASMLPDAIKHCRKVIVDCDSRLAGLFARSFPGARVYGTRQAKSKDGNTWKAEDREIDSSLPLGQIGEYFRTTPESFPGTPYLVPDPDRVTMWKGLWATKGKPIIGIAWNGGIRRTGAKFRRWTLEQLLPVLRSVDAHWVVLEYKSAAGELEAFRAKYPDVDIKEYPHATLSKDYDDTAALVASLDLVFCIQTAVAHLGGALGVPTWVCVPPCSQWRYGAEGESVPWYHSVRVIRQQQGNWNLGKIAAEISTHFGRVPDAAERAA